MYNRICQQNYPWSNTWYSSTAFVEKSGKLPVRIAAEYDAPVGKNACKLVNQIGVQVRSNLSSYNVKNWKNVDATTKDVVLQSIEVNLY